MQVDMANHNGALQPHTAKGMEADGASFVVLATRPIARDEQVFLTYGPLPNFMLLQQWGFVLPSLGTPPDVALVSISPLLEGGPEAGTESDGGPAAREAVKAAVERAVADGMLVKDPDGSPSLWQPAGGALMQAVAMVAAAESVAMAKGELSSEAAAAAGNALYRTLLRQTLDSYYTSIAEDGTELEMTGEGAPPPRRRLALLFRRTQKSLLNRELAETKGLRKPRPTF